MWAEGYVLHAEITTAGGDMWDAAGRYNSATPSYKLAYQARLLEILSNPVRAAAGLSPRSRHQASLGPGRIVTVFYTNSGSQPALFVGLRDRRNGQSRWGERRGWMARRASELMSDGALLDRLYTAVGTGAWQDFLEGLARAYDGGIAALVLHDARLGQGFASAHSETDPRNGTSYAEHYSRVSPWWQRAMSLPTGAVAHTDVLISPAEFRRTEFYNNWCRPQAIDLPIGVMLQRDASAQPLLQRAPVTRGAGAGRRRRGPARADRAASPARGPPARCPATRAPLRADAAEAAMAGLAMAMILADAKARPHFLNGTAEAIMARGDGLLLAGGVLDAVVPSEGGIHAGSIGVRRSAGPVRGERGAWGADAHLPPVRAPALEMPGRAGAAVPIWRSAGHALLFVRDPVARPERARPAARALRITPAEARLFEALLAGDALDEVAARHRLSRETPTLAAPLSVPEGSTSRRNAR